MKFIILCILLVYLYYKFSHPFWSRQPVFHYHNLLLWLSHEGIIDEEIPSRINKYFSYEIAFLKTSDLSKENKKKSYELISNHYLRTKNEAYCPPPASIFEYFYKQNNCFMSMHFSNRQLISTMTSRPLDCKIKGKQFTTNYVDFLCVHGKHRKKGVAPKTIYTHIVYCRENSDNKTFFFKREGRMTSIVPMTTYTTYGCMVSGKKHRLHHARIKNIKIIKENNSILYHFLNSVKERFQSYIVPSHASINNLIKKKLLHIYVVMYDYKPFGCYIFSETHTTYKGERSVSLMASCCLDRKELFVKYFYDCLHKISPKVILLEDISDNNKIIKDFLEKEEKIFATKTGYFFYNYLCKPVASKNVFIIN